MEIRATVYDKNEVFLIGFDGRISDAVIEQELARLGHDVEITERRQAEAPDTNTDSDLETLNALQGEYDNVDFVRVRQRR